MTHDSNPFLVVGLGASAGGLGALEAFFAGLPRTDGAAFVVVVHLAPDRESEMAEILGRSVPIPFVQVTERVKVERGHVYVIPPNRNLVMEDGHLRLEPLEDERHRRRPIDHFFRTLAEAWGEHAVGVVLSGTGHNGTVGAGRIRERGGLVLAQDPADASFDEMPRSAIDAGIVDLVASAGELAREVIEYAERLESVRVSEGASDLPGDDVEAVRHILAQLRVHTGHDFAHYKRATVLRRLARRLHVVGARSLHRLPRLPPRPPRRGPVAPGRPAHPRHQLFPRPGCVCPAGGGAARRVRGQAGRRRGARVGGRLRHRRGGLLGRDAALRARRGAGRPA